MNDTSETSKEFERSNHDDSSLRRPRDGSSLLHSEVRRTGEDHQEIEVVEFQRS